MQLLDMLVLVLGCNGYAFPVQIVFQGLKWEVVCLEGSLDRIVIFSWAWGMDCMFCISYSNVPEY